MIITKKHFLDSNKVRKDFKVIQISDLHYNDSMSDKKLMAIKREILKRRPDYIVFCGDMFFDKVKGYDRLYSFFQGLSKEIPVFITLGNHDFMTLDESKGGKLKWVPYDRSKEFTHLHNIPGIRVLHNEQMYLEDYNVLLTGIDTDYDHYETHKEDPYDFLEIVNEEFKKPLPRDTYNEISCHSPDIILNEKYFDQIIVANNADLIHSGHKHNGMVPPFVGFVLPKNRGIISPYLDVFPNLSRGRVKIGETTGIIGGPLTTFSETQGLKAKLINTAFPSRMDEIVVKRKVRR